MRSRSLVVALLAVSVSACDSGGVPTTTSPAPPSTTTITIPERATTTTTVDPAAADEETTERLAEAVSELVAAVEALRGLPFVTPPAVLALAPEAFAARLDAHHAAVLATAAPVGKTGLYRAVGLLSFETVERVLGRLSPPPTPVFYDAASFRIVVSGDVDVVDPVFRAATVHELVLALTDQHHATTQRRSELVSAGADDRLRSFDALVEGDATYFQLVYIQSMTPEEQTVVADAFGATDTPVVAGLPEFIRADLAFPYDAGTTFVAELVAAAGIAAVDRAHRDPPASSELVLHPERYLRGETMLTVAPLDVAVDGATVSASATFGEIQLDHLLSLALEPGLVTQTVDGWRGDQYQLVEAEGATAFALVLVMDSADDAIEVVGGLIAHARDVLRAGDAVESGGGLLFDDDVHYVFIDRVGDALMYVLATDRELGRAVRRQVDAP